MARLFFESMECKMWEKSEPGTSQSFVKNDTYTTMTTEVITFTSAIYYYEDLAVMVGKEKRFNDYYYNIIVSSNSLGKSWPLISIPAKLNIQIKRLTSNLFFVIGTSDGDIRDGSQVSFCKLKPSQQVDEITLNFSKLDKIEYQLNNHLIISYHEILNDNVRDENAKILYTFSLYNPEGKLVKNIFEYYNTDEFYYYYKIIGDIVMAYKVDKATKDENITLFDMKKLIVNTDFNGALG